MSGFDPVRTAILANRLDGIVREMTNTLLRAGRSSVIAVARDLSCAICTADHQLLASAEGLPIHIFGAQLQCRAMAAAHDDLAEGDCFLHNDPYTGNTHPADHTFLVPVFHQGVHLFTAVAKAHQADIGNAAPTTYHAAARDQYEEGALIFPSVRIQRGFRTNEDVVRMGRARIRVPDQWEGDFLAGIGAARIAERRLKVLVEGEGEAAIRRFIEDWFAYSEARMAEAIGRLPARRLETHGRHDPFPPFQPEPIPFRLGLEIDPAAGRITLDLTGNGPNVSCGLNQSEACATSAVLAGTFNALGALVPDLPKNAGAFRRVTVRLQDDCVVGRPRFPHSCSVATTNLADRLVNATQAAFAQLGDGFGLAEGGVGQNACKGVVSGDDPRHGRRYVNQLMLGGNGGPATPHQDGWVTYNIPVVSGLMYRESVELAELKHPFHVRHLRCRVGAGGAGRQRGAPGFDIAWTPATAAPVTVMYQCDGQETPAAGAAGGEAGAPGETWLTGTDGVARRQPAIQRLEVRPGETVRALSLGGGGYGDPATRDPARVLADVQEGWETQERARTVYRVALTGSRDDGTLTLDAAGTAALRGAR